VESWEEIYRDLKDPKKRAKSELCKRKADDRVASGATPFSHRTGHGGYKAIVAKFVSGILLHSLSGGYMHNWPSVEVMLSSNSKFDDGEGFNTVHECGQ
jgi:hypothetical protein